MSQYFKIISSEEKTIIKNSDRIAFLKWKRKNVTLRGVKTLGEFNEQFASFGKGLYTVFLSNRTMAKNYGKVYFVVNAIPKKPKIVQNVNKAEIFIQELISNYCDNKNVEYSRSFFESNTSIESEVIKLGFDGLIISGREIVNYIPSNDVMYFETEEQLYNYWINKNKEVN